MVWVTVAPAFTCTMVIGTFPAAMTTSISSRAEIATFISNLNSGLFLFAGSSGLIMLLFMNVNQKSLPSVVKAARLPPNQFGSLLINDEAAPIHCDKSRAQTNTMYLTDFKLNLSYLYSGGGIGFLAAQDN